VLLFVAESTVIQVAVKNLKIKIYRNIILPVVLYECGIWSLKLRDERRLRVFENRVLRRVFGTKRDKVAGQWRKLHNEEIRDLYSLPNIVRVVKSRRMRWVEHVAGMLEWRVVQRVLVGKPEGKRPFGIPRREWEYNIRRILGSGRGWRLGGFGSGRKDRTLVTVTSDSVHKGRTVNCTARSNTAMMCTVLCFGQCPECTLLSVRESEEYLSMCVKQRPECLQVSVIQCTKCLSMCGKQRPEC